MPALHLWSLEDDRRHAELMQGHLKAFGLADRTTMVEAPLLGREIGGSRFTWYAGDRLPEGDIDLLVVDGPARRAGRLVRYPAGSVFFPAWRSEAWSFWTTRDDGASGVSSGAGPPSFRT